MKIKWLTYILSVLLFCGCKGTDAIVDTGAPKPQWVDSRPLNSSFYIGIGSASKRIEPLEYSKTAKKNALDDLTSEISVNVKSESFLKTMQTNQYFDESFTSAITTFSEERIEDFEVVDVWEDRNEYWIYYRLSKVQHEQIKREKKQNAMSAAADLYLKGKTAEDSGNLRVAFDLMLRGLYELAAYWNEVNEFDLEGKRVFLDNEIFSHLREMMNHTELTVTPSNIVLNASNGFEKDAMVNLTLDGKPISNALLEYHYRNRKYKSKKNVRTDPQGYAPIAIRNVDQISQQNELTVVLNLKDLTPTDLDQTLMDPLIESLLIPEITLPLAVELPKIIIISSETNLDNPNQLHWASGALQESLTNKGFTFTSKKDQADYYLYVEASTKEGGTSQGFHVAYLDMKIIVKDASENVVYQASRNGIKGLQLNFEDAGIEAFKKATKQVKKDILQEITDAIF